MSKPIDLDAIQAIHEAGVPIHPDDIRTLIAELREARAKLAKLPHHCGDEACRQRLRYEDPRLCNCHCDGCLDAEEYGVYAHEAKRWTT